MDASPDAEDRAVKRRRDAEEDDLLLFMCLLCQKSSRLREPRLNRVPSDALPSFFANADSLAWEKYVRLSPQVFNLLLHRVTPIFEKLSLRPAESSGSRPKTRALDTKTSLFITLRLLAADLAYSDGVLLSGVSPSTFTRTVAVMLPCLLVALRHWSVASIGLPTEDEAKKLSARMAGRYPELARFIGFVDGLSTVYLKEYVSVLTGEVHEQENSGDARYQNMHYNGKDRAAATKVHLQETSQ